MESDSSVLESPEEILSTMGKDGKRRWLYPKVIQGRFFHGRRILGLFLIALYVFVPFIKINGKPLLLLDIIGREFIVFGKTFFATDTLLFLLLILSIGIFIIGMTAVLGRVWCGWACPQTVYLEFVFRPIESLIEGSPNKRKKRDESAPSFDTLWRKVLKYSIYLLISAVLANAFLAYFIGSDTLVEWMQQSPLDHPAPFLLMLFVTALVMFDFSYFREQMCTIACPYARLQSVLLDKNSIIVGYDEKRGEPRSKGRERDGKGDCIDCHQCVDVCPTGIDIRKGLQLECLHCAQCVDACDSVMHKIGKPLGLIRYSSLEEFRGGVLKIWRPRTLLYILGFALLVTAFIYRLETRADSSVQILRAGGEPYRIIESSGLVSNLVQIKISNLGDTSSNYNLHIKAQDKLESIIPVSKIVIEPKQQAVVTAFINFQADIISEHVEIEITGDHGFEKKVIHQLRKP